MTVGLAVATAGLMFLASGVLAALAEGFRSSRAVAAAPALSFCRRAVAGRAFGQVARTWNSQSVGIIFLPVPEVLVAASLVWNRVERPEGNVLVAGATAGQPELAYRNPDVSIYRLVAPGHV